MPSLVKRGGQLFEEETSLADRVKAAGTTPPSTAFSAQTLGATPDQAKMVGTPAQKKSAIQQAPKKEATLQGQQRLDQPRQDATPQETGAASLSKSFAGLGGSMGSRVQALIDQRLQNAAQGNVAAGLNDSQLVGALGLNPTQLAAQKADPNSVYSQAQTALKALSATPTGPAAELALQTLAKLGVKEETARSMINTGASSIGQHVAANTADTLTVGDIDVTQLGFQSPADLANALGVQEAQLAGMSLAQLQTAAQDVQKRDLATVDTLRAQLATTPVGSAQYQILLRQLQDAGQVGVTGSEQQADEAIQKLNTADQVEVGGMTVSVEDVLKDENLSNLIVEYVNASPEQKERLLPAAKFASLRQWVDNNQLALSTLANDLQTTTKAFTDTQTAWANMGQIGNVQVSDEVLKTLVPEWDRNTPITSAELNEAKNKLQNSGVGKVLADPAAGKEIAGKLTPENVNAIKDLTADQIKSANDYSKIANGPEYQKLLGLDGPQDFITDPALQAKIDELKPAIDLMRKAGVADRWLQDPNFLKLTPAQMKAMAENPDQFEDFQGYHKLKEQVTKAKTPAEIFSVLFGSTVTDKDIAGMQTEYANLQKMAKLGAPGAKEKLAEYEAALDANKDGKIDDTDAMSLMERLKANLDTNGTDAILEGKDLSEIFKPMDDAPLSSRYVPNDRLFLSLSDFMEDGQITPEEMSSLGPDTLAEIVAGNYADIVKGPAKAALGNRQNAGVQQEYSMVAPALEKVANGAVEFDIANGIVKLKTQDPHKLLEVYSNLLGLPNPGPAAKAKMDEMKGWLKTYIGNAARNTISLLKDKTNDFKNKIAETKKRYDEIVAKKKAQDDAIRSMKGYVQGGMFYSRDASGRTVAVPLIRDADVNSVYGSINILTQQMKENDVAIAGHTQKFQDFLAGN